MLVIMKATCDGCDARTTSSLSSSSQPGVNTWHRLLTYHVVCSTDSSAEIELVARQCQTFVLMVHASMLRLEELADLAASHAALKLEADICEYVLQKLLRIVFLPQTIEVLAIPRVHHDVSAQVPMRRLLGSPGIDPFREVDGRVVADLHAADEDVDRGVTKG
jgi:hypothetical protein